MKYKISDIEQEIKHLPAGYLVKKRKYFYQIIGVKEKGITNNINLIKQLARKRFLIEQKKDITKTPEDVINNLPSTYQNLPYSFFYHIMVHQWLKQLEIKNTYPFSEVYYSNNKTKLRSKSELIIANALEELKIPYRYENRLILNNKKVYPDFIVKNPFTNKTIIWEHFGALDKPGYERSMNEKMKAYLEHGFTPFDNLIYTFESDLNRIKDIINKIILQK